MKDLGFDFRPGPKSMMMAKSVALPTEKMFIFQPLITFFVWFDPLNYMFLRANSTTGGSGNWFGQPEFNQGPLANQSLIIHMMAQLSILWIMISHCSYCGSVQAKFFDN